MLWEVVRLEAGGDANEELATRLSPEERAVFEIGLIEALTRGKGEHQLRLRRALIKCGYDEHCAQRARKEPIADHVRASTLLSLLNPELGEKTAERSRAAARSE
ncbi:MAG TPA: hypothetical protein VFB82_18135 [Blastocatellia bacterium]|nr:hypothetical protein [Blastocatellia bacterium]